MHWRHAHHADPAFRESGHRRLGEGEASDWLRAVRERGQTLDEYLAAGPIRPNGAHRVLVLRAVGDSDETHARRIEKTAAFLSLFYELPVRVETALAIPDSPSLYRYGLRGRPRQYDASRLAATMLRSRMPPDALLYVGLTREDLFTGPMAFVFGLAGTHERAAILSTARLGAGAATETEILARTIRVTTHEVGHTLTILHCVFYECIMNGSNTLAEMDRRPLRLCPLDLEKLHRNHPFDPAAREAKIRVFFAREGLRSPSAPI